jgi:exodeoxyribonuclease-3
MPDSSITITSWNVNGIRAVASKNLLPWEQEISSDLICLQEVKAHPEQLSPELITPNGYKSFFNSAERKGYSGVAIYAKHEPMNIHTSIGHDRFDTEGRLLHLTYPSFHIMNVYMPNGGGKEENLLYKLDAYDALLAYLEPIKDEHIIIVGDFNIAYDDRDLHDPDRNRNSVMYTPTERKKIHTLVEDLSFTDTFRTIEQEGGHYTWWPYWRNARERDHGWRIDYILCSQPTTQALTNAQIHKTIFGSDHCPIEASFTF